MIILTSFYKFFRIIKFLLMIDHDTTIKLTNVKQFFDIKKMNNVKIYRIVFLQFKGQCNPWYDVIDIPSGFAVEVDPCSSEAPLLGEARPEFDECGAEVLVDDTSPRPSCSATST